MNKSQATSVQPVYQSEWGTYVCTHVTWLSTTFCNKQHAPGWTDRCSYKATIWHVRWKTWLWSCLWPQSRNNRGGEVIYYWTRICNFFLSLWLNLSRTYFKYCHHKIIMNKSAVNFNFGPGVTKIQLLLIFMMVMAGFCQSAFSLLLRK